MRKILLIIWLLFCASQIFPQTYPGLKLKNLKTETAANPFSVKKGGNYRLHSLIDTNVSLFGSDNFGDSKGLVYDSSYVWKKHYVVPAFEVIALNFGVWSVSRYMNPMPWARISFNSINENLKHMWVWDADHFETNQFMHPYHGNTYFNFARSSGLNFWQSAPYSMGGSLMWELFMETNYPSRNDLISTTLGGIALGEMTYRLSSKIIDERTTGFERVMREIGAFIIAPTRGINRFFKGDMSAIRSKSIYEIENVKSLVSISAGIHYKAGKLYDADGNVSVRYDLYYGNPYTSKDRKPYDFFNVKAVFNFGNQPLINQVNVYGFILGKNLKYRDDQKILIGMFQHFDYYDNTDYKIGAQSLGGGIIYKFPTLPEVDFESSIHLAGIVLGGGTNIKEAFKYESDGTAYRDYNFGMGFTSKFESIMNVSKKGYLFIGLYDFQIYTIDGADGHDNLLIFNPRLAIAVSPRSNVGVDFNIYHRRSNYVSYKDFKTTVSEIKIFISNNF